MCSAISRVYGNKKKKKKKKNATALEEQWIKGGTRMEQRMENKRVTKEKAKKEEPTPQWKICGTGKNQERWNSDEKKGTKKSKGRRYANTKKKKKKKGESKPRRGEGRRDARRENV
ncbi:conserved Plasmodium protein, unknown function [Plasmodium knowlesi strain H]|uniref:Uncharacterized protein n=3 Tax=Plasmodium knowlesi TaxID=5850 RepID=A0A5K1VRE5_PLAKH|nr:conserved Plasmodium protein, unknown function [Plasmodium knowlesi strain H]OTN64756.1 Uncharacterized protein PKNOH_S130204700 [Plasmodium knowlesi]CAA9989207.1 conserved Plasmodium protein, unknown function [Plasmodium knowlesi strain H]SBO27247.1 conserved Plasmodium protein, unknown function [Plasmodium knowlesi strain H]VVS78681.1 conserved Plasmodium protein, unknown function [Plasmodium knowlesi strain H]|eukprot:XP_002261552.1 hypothetical protein, conserved in Plasmodium species [Plasmodium knowlesi strain H]